MTFVGMDLAAVQRGADSMSMQSGELASLLGQLDGTISNLSALWPGPDCDAFQNTWFERHRPALLAVANELTARAQWVVQQLQDQVDVSGMTMDQVRGVTLGVCEAVPAPSSQEMLYLSYGANDQERDDELLRHGWRRVTDAKELEGLGVSPGMLRDSSTGFSASIFRNADGRVVVTYEGTHDWGRVRLGPGGPYFSPGTDLRADVVGAVALSRQSEQAVQLAQAVKGSMTAPGMLYFTGHSLGGRLAAVSSIATGAPAETFSAAGVSPSEMMYAHIAGGGQAPSLFQWLETHNPMFPDQYDAALLGVDTSHIVNHDEPNDILGILQGVNGVPDAAGQQQYTGFDTWNFVDAHGLDSLDNQID
ncbi:hypothetical protein [Nocardioides sp. MH1]|uniref:hypothetical protein n=1 Tax=Nocardioides sp. MH1 TaxID=3242490 RepID=UPI003520FE47